MSKCILFLILFSIALFASAQNENYEAYKPKLKAFFEVSFSSEKMHCIFVAIQEQGEITTLTLLKSSDKFESFKERIFTDANCTNCILANTYNQVEDPVEFIYDKIEAGQVYIVYNNKSAYKLEQYLNKAE